MEKKENIQKSDTRPLMVSIRCITYNHEPYIRQCLEGFVMQKTNFRFEAIVHDDASTDGTAAIIREYAEKYPDIIKPIYETENQYSKHDGSLKRIMDEACKGKYIALCEGDDYWTDPNKLQIQVDFMESHPDYSMCFHNAYIKWETGDDSLEMMGHYIAGDFGMSQILESWPLPTASIVFQRTIYDTPIYKKLISLQGVNGDICIFMSCGYVGKVHGFEKIMSIYRKHYGGISHIYVQHPDKFLHCDFTVVEAINDRELTKVMNKRVEKLLAYKYMKPYLQRENVGIDVITEVYAHNKWIVYKSIFLYIIFFLKVKIKALFLRLL